MWTRDIRAVTFSDSATLRCPPKSEVLPAAIYEALLVRGVSVSRETFLEGWGRATRLRLEARWGDLSEEPFEATLASFIPEQVDGLSDVVAHAVESIASSIEWFPDALPTLDFLREAGYRIAVVGDSPGPLGRTWLARMAPWIDIAVLSRDVGRVKPHPSMFKEVLVRLGVLPKQVLHVGDQPVADVFGAKTVGMRTALLERVPRDPPSPQSFEWLKRVQSFEPQDVVPDLKIRSLEEIPAVLDQFG